jgi:hypothetical protein
MRAAETDERIKDSNGKAAATVALVELDVRTLKLRVVSMSPYICHAWSAKAVRMMEDTQQKKAKGGKTAKVPQDEYEGCFYTDEEGRRCIPARSFKNAMASAATSIDDKRFPKTKIKQAIFVHGDLLPIEGEKPIMRTDTVRLNGKTADIRYRPEFREWSVVLTIQYNANVVSAEQVVNLLNLSGFAVGVGEWRPEKSGSYGRYSVERKEGQNNG